MKKAYIVIPHWCSDQSVQNHKYHSRPVYSESSGKAKYLYMMEIEDESDDWFRYRALRWPEMDLFDPEPSEIIKSLPESAVKKMSHTYGAKSSSPGYRNFYNGSVSDKDFLLLIEKGLAERNSSRDNILSEGTTYYHLTEKGQKEIMTTRSIKRENRIG